MPDYPDDKPPTIPQVVGWYVQMAGLFSQRNAEYHALRRAFAGSFASSQQSSALGLGEFNDRKKLSYNLVNFSIRRYMDELSSPHRIMGVPNGVEPFDIDLSERRQKALEKLKLEEGIDLKVIKGAFHQGLLDKAVWHVRPDAKAPMKVRVQLVTPEHYFPIPYSGDWAEKRAVIVSWVPFDMGALTANTDPNGQTNHSAFDSNRVIEYWDRRWYIRVQGDTKQGSNGAYETIIMEHKIDEVLFEEAHNIPLPDQQRGQGDVDHVLGLNEALNEGISDQADVLSYLANPIVVVRGSRSGTKGLTWGTGAIWDLERDGSAEILTWAGAPPTFEAHILRLMQGIEDGTGLNSPAFGREIPSGVSGEAVRSILAGFNTRVGTKQQLMALSLASLYRKVQKVWEVQFPSWEISVSGERSRSLSKWTSGKAGTSIKPSEFLGHYDVQVIFEPQNENVKIFAELQKLQAGVQSRLTTMKRLGISAPEDEYKRVILEKMLDAELAAKSIGAQPQPGMGGGMGMPMDPNRQIPMEQPMNVSSLADIASGLGNSDPGTLAEELTGIKGLKPGGRGDVKVQDLMDRLEEANLDDEVRAEGRIAAEGKTPDKFRLRVKNPGDADKVRRALGPLSPRAEIVIGDTEPVDGDTMSVGRPNPARGPRYGR